LITFFYFLHLLHPVLPCIWSPVANVPKKLLAFICVCSLSFTIFCFNFLRVSVCFVFCFFVAFWLLLSAKQTTWHRVVVLLAVLLFLLLLLLWWWPFPFQTHLHTQIQSRERTHTHTHLHRFMNEFQFVPAFSDLRVPFPLVALSPHRSLSLFPTRFVSLLRIRSAIATDTIVSFQFGFTNPAIR